MSTDYMAILNSTGQGAGTGAMAGGGWGALAGGAMGLMGGIAGESAKNQQIEQQGELMKQGIKGNKELMDYQQQKQYEMWLKTNYSDQVKQMEKAGLNPALMYKGAGGGGITGSVSSGGVSQGNASSQTDKMNANNAMTGMALQNAKLAAEIRNIEADTRSKNVGATKTEGVDTEHVKADIDLIKTKTENTKVATEGEELSNQLKDIEIMVSRGSADLRINKLRNEVEYTEKLIAKISAELPYVGDMAKAELSKLLADVKNINEDTKGKEFENTKEQQELRTFLKEETVRKIMAEAGITEEDLRLYLQGGIKPSGALSGPLVLLRNIFELMFNRK